MQISGQEAGKKAQISVRGRRRRKCGRSRGAIGEGSGYFTVSSAPAAKFTFLARKGKRRQGRKMKKREGEGERIFFVDPGPLPRASEDKTRGGQGLDLPSSLRKHQWEETFPPPGRITLPQCLACSAVRVRDLQSSAKRRTCFAKHYPGRQSQAENPRNLGPVF